METKNEIEEYLAQLIEHIKKNKVKIWIEFLSKKLKDLKKSKGKEYDKTLLSIDKCIGGMGSLTDLDMKKNDTEYKDTLHRLSLSISFYLLENNPQIVNFSTKRKVALFLNRLMLFFMDNNDEIRFKLVEEWLSKLIPLDSEKEIDEFLREFIKFKKDYLDTIQINDDKEKYDYLFINKLFTSSLK